MSLNQCDRVARCEENYGHAGPCSFNAALQRLVDNIEQWHNDESIQHSYSLYGWLSEELREAKEWLGDA
jgi:hypothetical protein